MIIYQKYIKREDLRANPDVLYVFGDNVERKGYGGQAWEMRGEPNAVGIATKRSIMEFFSDDDLDEILNIIEDDMEPLRKQFKMGGTAVYPYDGIGTGLADLPNQAPKVYEYLCALKLGGYNV